MEEYVHSVDKEVIKEFFESKEIVMLTVTLEIPGMERLEQERVQKPKLVKTVSFL